MLKKILSAASLAFLLNTQAQAQEPPDPFINEVRTETRISENDFDKERVFAEFGNARIKSDQFNDEEKSNITQLSYTPNKQLDDVSAYFLRANKVEDGKRIDGIGLDVTKVFDLGKNTTLLVNPGYIANIESHDQQYIFASARGDKFTAEYIQFGDMTRDDVIYAIRGAVKFDKTYLTAALNDDTFKAIGVYQDENLININSMSANDEEFNGFTQFGFGEDAKSFTNTQLDNISTGLMMPVFFKPYIPNYTSLGNYSARLLVKGEENIDFVEALGGMKINDKVGSVGLGATFDDGSFGVKASYYKNFKFGKLNGSLDVQASPRGVDAYVRLGVK